jgi:hypothetical protein
MEEFPAGWIDLFVQQIREPALHVLRVIVAEPKASPHSERIGVGDLTGHRLCIGADSLFIELTWHEVVSYHVLMESYTSVGPRKTDDGKYVSMLEVIKDSSFIAHLSTISFASDDYPGPLKHYRLITLTHIIDVISVISPVFRKLSSFEAAVMNDVDHSL